MSDEYDLWVIMAEISNSSQLSRNCQIPHTQYYLDNDDIYNISSARQTVLSKYLDSQTTIHYQKLDLPLK